jgi:hypothetical protein
MASRQQVLFTGDLLACTDAIAYHGGPCTHPCNEPVKAVPIRCRCMNEVSLISG